MIIGSGVRFGVRIKAYSLILEPTICGGANNAAMDYTSGIISEDLESHGISNIGSHANPPACLFFGRQEGLIRV